MGFLSHHFENVRQSILAKGDELGVSNHGTLKGSARELVVSEFLAANLPRGFDFSTGEITAPNGDRSGQIDVLILPQTAPRLSLGGSFSLGLLHAVAAVVEVKSNLTTADLASKSELRNALETTKSVKNLRIEPPLTPWPWTALKEIGEVKLQHIPVSIVAFDGPTIEKLGQHLLSWSEGGNPLPNTVTCLRRNYTLVLNDEWIYTRAKLPVGSRSMLYIHTPETGAALRDLFDFLMKSLQAWTYAQPRTPLRRCDIIT